MIAVLKCLHYKSDMDIERTRVNRKGKTVPMYLRVRPKYRSFVEKRALAEGMSYSAYIERLIQARISKEAPRTKLERRR